MIKAGNVFITLAPTCRDVMKIIRFRVKLLQGQKSGKESSANAQNYAELFSSTSELPSLSVSFKDSGSFRKLSLIIF